MSLQVWLPFNGDLRNQGLLGYFSDSTTQGATNPFSQDGKIGKCLCYDNNLNTIIRDSSNTKIISLFNTGKIFSVAFWFKLKGVGTSAQIFQIGNTTNGNYGLWWTNNTSGIGPRLVWNDGNGGKSTGIYANLGYNTATDYENWHHFVGIIDKTNQTVQTETFYLDGQFVDSNTYDNSSSNQLVISTNNNFIYLRPYYAMFNDVRIYDHALSTKEVEEIAKGLVLHYKLNNEEYTNENLFSLENIYVNNSTVTKVVTGDTIELTSRAVNYGGFSANTYIDFEAGVTYTLSGHIKVIQKGTDNYTPILCIRNDNNIIQVSQSVINNESDVIMTLTPTSTFRGYVSGINTWSSGSSNITNAITEFSKIKLEISSIKTPYIPNSNDGLYIALGYNKNIIYDCSGYNNNGSVIGNLTTINDTPRYYNASNMNNTSTSNHIEGLNNFVFADNILSMSFWIKIANKATSQILAAFPQIQFGLVNSKGYLNPVDAAGFTTDTFENNQWNHIVCIRNGNTYQLYINGTVQTQNASNNFYSHNASALWLLNRSTNNAYAANASIVDFRMYATALTEAQVKELYNTSATIDKNGNIYTRELVEI